MTFTELKQALADRGQARLSAAQQGTHVNNAMHELDAEELWPYRQTSTTGAAPLAITDLGQVETVFTTTGNTPLIVSTYAEMVARVGDLTKTAADPTYWYFTSAGAQSISTFPVTTRTLKVQYWKVGTDLSGGSDTPLAPARWHHVIVAIADRLALEAKGDYASAQAVQATVDRELAKMRTDLLYRQTMAAAYYLPMGCENW